MPGALAVSGGVSKDAQGLFWIRRMRAKYKRVIFSWRNSLTRAGLPSCRPSATHGAVVTRKYGLPAGLGVPDATKRIADGAFILVDGEGGCVVLPDGRRKNAIDSKGFCMVL